MFKILFRDNRLVNVVVRSFLKLAALLPLNLSWAMNRYRVYGNIKLNIEDVQFFAYSRADDFIVNELYYGLAYELEEFKLLKAVLPQSSFFIDVGANTGIFSLFSAAVNPALKVISFEPHPGNYQRLKKNFSLNPKLNADLLPLAVGEQEQKIRFTVPKDDSISTTSSANAAFTRHFHSIPFKEIEVTQTTMDTALASLPISSCDLIKIDVEYYELSVLKGAHRILTEKKPFVIMEILRYSGLIEKFPEMDGKLQSDHAHQIESLMLSCGYEIYRLEASGIYRINSIFDTEHLRNFLFVPSGLSEPFYTFQELQVFIKKNYLRA
jgi:FkbM family methyltransferase